MGTKEKLQKEIDDCDGSNLYSYKFIDFYTNVKAIVARMPDDKSETKPVIDIRKDEDYRKQLIKYFKDNAILYGDVSVHTVLAVSDFLLKLKPEPSLLEVAMHFYKSDGMKVSFDIAEKLIAENERRKK